MQGLPAAFANKAFGKFLDLKRSAPITADACRAVMRLVKVLSQSYIHTETANVKLAMAALKPDFQGRDMGSEAAMMEDVREVLHSYLREVMSKSYTFLTMEPSLASLVSVDQPL